MGMNKQKGNMYPFVTHTWNPIRGKCPHGCVYCYMKGFPQPELNFVEKEMETNLGKGNFIFVGSSTDMWCHKALAEWLFITLKHCCKYPLNRYLFQSKDPQGVNMFLDFMPPDFILGTTLETNRDYEISEAPTSEARMLTMRDLPQPKMISIEPIMDFDLDILIDWVRQIAPVFVSIGADSKGHNLPEPSRTKVNMLIEELASFTIVKIKENLKRLR
jgi:DNA repair photolyase